MTNSAGNWTTTRFGTLTGMSGAPPSTITVGSITASANAVAVSVL